ncbi:hypothetical protein F4604DRAFT_1930409 [Suillus subluteus]|nr:hypothetical protein F4604DRAFT_1930409 [Suillus subluteus]
MPPKRCAKAFGLSRKKAKAGVVFSGISRSAPGELDVSSMVKMPSSPSVALKLLNILADAKTLHYDSGNINPASPAGPVATVAPNPLSTNIIISTFCHFCCDQTNCPHNHKCIDCGTIVCEQFLAHSSSCIYLNIVEVGKKDFWCLICLRTGDGKDKPLQYVLIGFGRRKKVKMAWLMAIVNLNLESMKDDYLAKSLILEAENHF